MKKLATLVTALVFVLSFALPQGSAFAKSDAVAVYVDGVEVEGYEQAFVSHDQVLLPVEDLFNEAGFKVTKDPSGAVNVSNTYLTVDFKASASTIEVNGKKADTEFPLTLQNYGNYISGDFLATLEGFEVEVAEDQKSVNITTNRLAEAEVAALLAKSAAAELNSVSTAMTMDMKMESSLEEEAIDMKMDITMDQIMDPMSFYTLTKMSTNLAGEKLEETSAVYLTEEGYFQQIGDVWVKFEDELTEGLLDVATQEDLLAQLEALQTKFTSGLNIYEYDDVYVMTQTISNEEFGEMMEEVTALLLGSDLTGTIVSEEVLVEGTEEEATEVEAAEVVAAEEVATEEEATEEEATEEVATEEEATEEEATEEEAIEEVEFEGLFDGLEFNIKEFYVTSTIDKKTLFPVDISAIANITMTMDEDTITISLVLAGTFSDFNAVKEIKVPAEVVKNAISMDEFMKILEAELEKALAEEDAA